MGVVEQVLMVDQLVGGGSHQRVAWQQELQFQHIKRSFDIPKPLRSPDVRMTGYTPSFCEEILVIMESCDCNYVEQQNILV